MSRPGDKVLDLARLPRQVDPNCGQAARGRTADQQRPEPGTDEGAGEKLELYGVRNGVVLREHPERIAASFPAFFDKILVDAPARAKACSARTRTWFCQWTEESPDKYRHAAEILKSAANMLKPGGRIVYSTCTFLPKKTRRSSPNSCWSNHVLASLRLRAGCSLREPPAGFGGHMEESDQIPDDIWEQAEQTSRLWPHLIEGEGHFVAVLQHDGTGTDEPGRFLAATDRGSSGGARLDGKGKNRKDRSQGMPKKGKEQRKAGRDDPAAQLEAYGNFVRDHLGFVPGGYTIMFGQHVYQSPLPPGALDGLKAVRPGWYMGDAKNGRFVPAHPLATPCARRSFAACFPCRRKRARRSGI
ncbi:RsmF rRNA methyltransferase first C-terminal domain-containing protein [Paenibacillus sp. JTLBN-2024]